jgi:chromosome segregation protein
VFLRRVTITGFKSFAAKTVLDLEPGVTAIVGPNGSGKSNLADAIRWALGEQNKGRLRLVGKEELVFAGTEKKARASYAEVTLLFDNEDGKLPVDRTEVEVSRRLYRNGETDYRLAGRSVRLSEVQGLMVSAGFGVGTYAVIGQGMIDSFLMSPPAERKLLFDEAVGIRGPEQSRQQALHKLEQTTENLVRLSDLAAELGPRRTSLASSLSGAGSLESLETKVRELRIRLSGAKLSQAKSREAEAKADLRNLEEELAREQRVIEELESEVDSRRQRDLADRTLMDKTQARLNEVERSRDQVAIDLVTMQNSFERARQAKDEAAALQKVLARAQRDLSEAEAKAIEMDAELAQNQEAADRALMHVERASHAVSEAQTALVLLRKSTSDTTRNQYVDNALHILRALAVTLSAEEVELEEVRLLVHKAGRLLSHAGQADAADLLARLKSAQKQLESAMIKRETAIEHQTNVTITIRSLEIDRSHQAQSVERAKNEVAQIRSRLDPLTALAGEASELKARVASLTKDAREMAASTDELRQEAARLAARSADSDERSDMRARLERARITHAALGTSKLDAKTRLSQAESIRQVVLARAATWHIDIPDEAHQEPVADLENLLLRAEAQHEATSVARRDQAAQYEALDERHTELVTQIADLELAKANLALVVAELDERIKERFRTNFSKLAEQFSHYFSQLFMGGSASLVLEEGTDSEFGIEVRVSPPGKRATSLAALSGGERALAGVALLAAIIRTNPGPFVVLDEIDAALDEANSTRLSEILTSLKQHTQLIVVTHNRQTMSAARVLFGVTMNEHHVSQLLSMRLEEATQLAAR